MFIVFNFVFIVEDNKMCLFSVVEFIECRVNGVVCCFYDSCVMYIGFYRYFVLTDEESEVQRSWDMFNVIEVENG